MGNCFATEVRPSIDWDAKRLKIAQNEAKYGWPPQSDDEWTDLVIKLSNTYSTARSLIRYDRSGISTSAYEMHTILDSIESAETRHGLFNCLQSLKSMVRDLSIGGRYRLNKQL